MSGGEGKGGVVALVIALVEIEATAGGAGVDGDLVAAMGVRVEGLIVRAGLAVGDRAFDAARVEEGEAEILVGVDEGVEPRGELDGAVS